MSAYRGPGRYRNNIDAEETRVLGLTRVGGLASHYVLCEEQDGDDGVKFFAERIDVFNGATTDDDPAYEYIGPLEER
jgi:hypothetical protein